MANGRPRKEFEPHQFEKLCALQCTESEISSWFDFSVDTLARRLKEFYDGQTFPQVFEKFSCEGKMSLRRTQFEMAKKSPAMAIWLGKQYLGQKEYSPVPAIFSQTINNSVSASLELNLKDVSDDDLVAAAKILVGGVN